MPTAFAPVKGVHENVMSPVIARRERLRTAAVAEIKDLARRLLVSGGPPAISLRGIARDMGMTAPAIYRYFPSLDALVAELTGELFDELREAIEAGRDTVPAEPLTQLLEMARAFRRWSLAHPPEFALMFGTPVPGVVGFEVDCISPEHPGAKFGAPFLAAFAEVWETTPFRTPPPEVIEAELGAHLAPYRAAFGPDVPVEIIYAYLSAWTRLYGMVALEVFGHMRWAVDDMGALFELELAAFARDLLGP
jgi:AcrR family transcriptional regulator